MPGEYDVHRSSPDEDLDEETNNAIRILDSVVMHGEAQFKEGHTNPVIPTPRTRKSIASAATAMPGEGQILSEQDRDVEEVSEGEAVEGSFPRGHGVLLQL